MGQQQQQQQQQHMPMTSSPGQNLAGYSGQTAIRNVTPPPSVVRLPMPQSPQQQRSTRPGNC